MSNNYTTRDAHNKPIYRAPQEKLCRIPALRESRNIWLDSVPLYTHTHYWFLYPFMRLFSLITRRAFFCFSQRRNSRCAFFLFSPTTILQISFELYSRGTGQIYAREKRRVIVIWSPFFYTYNTGLRLSIMDDCVNARGRCCRGALLSGKLYSFFFFFIMDVRNWVKPLDGIEDSGKLEIGKAVEFQSVGWRCYFWKQYISVDEKKCLKYLVGFCNGNWSQKLKSIRAF